MVLRAVSMLLMHWDLCPLSELVLNEVLSFPLEFTTISVFYSNAIYENENLI